MRDVARDVARDVERDVARDVERDVERDVARDVERDVARDAHEGRCAYEVAFLTKGALHRSLCTIDYQEKGRRLRRPFS